MPGAVEASVPEEGIRRLVVRGVGVVCSAGLGARRWLPPSRSMPRIQFGSALAAWSRLACVRRSLLRESGGVAPCCFLRFEVATRYASAYWTRASSMVASQRMRFWRAASISSRRLRSATSPRRVTSCAVSANSFSVATCSEHARRRGCTESAEPRAVPCRNGRRRRPCRPRPCAAGLAVDDSSRHGAVAQVPSQPDEPDGAGVDRLDRMPPPRGRWHPTGRGPESATRSKSADRRR